MSAMNTVAMGSAEVQELLKCPISGKHLQRLSETEVVQFNQLIKSGQYYFGDGNLVSTLYEAVLKVEGEDIYYPVQQDILCLLPDFAMVQDCAQFKIQGDPLSEDIKQEIKSFYDQIGWQKDEKEAVQFKDATDSEDLRSVSEEYINQCHLRLHQHITPKGKYLLDAASGPIQYPAYLNYSRDYQYRICADLSLTGLLSAREKLGNKGIYILCDITNLPLQSDQVDTVLSLHTLYHVPQSQQQSAFDELYRVLKPGGQSVIVYSWGKNSSLMKVFLLPFKLVKRAFNLFSQKKPPLYFYANTYSWFGQQLKSKYNTKLYVWRSVNVPFLKIYIHKLLAGRLLLKWIYWLEEKCPKTMGRIGAYPLFVTKKPIS
tara:strand:- start:13256 stop:14374 length:1119 start_codon:yes stop_codon:yes gene_type:complete